MRGRSGRCRSACGGHRRLSSHTFGARLRRRRSITPHAFGGEGRSRSRRRFQRQARKERASGDWIGRNHSRARRRGATRGSS